MFGTRIITKIVTAMAIVFFSCSCYADKEPIDTMFHVEATKISMLSMNENGEIAWHAVNGNLHLFYSSTSLGGEIIDVTEVVGCSLFQMGYKPKEWRIEGKCGSQECKYFLDYQIYSANYGRYESNEFMDSSGNIFVTFIYDGLKIENTESGYRPNKLGVWNKNFGFKILNIPEIEEVISITKKGDYLFIYGRDASRTKETVAVVSFADGFWDNHK